MTVRLAAFIAASCLASLAQAQEPPDRPGGPPADKASLEALFDRTDSNSDGKLTKDEVPEERRGMRMIFDRVGGDSIDKEQFVRGMLAVAQNRGEGPGGRARDGRPGARGPGDRGPGDRGPGDRGPGGRGPGGRGPGDRGPGNRGPGDRGPGGPPGSRPGGPPGIGLFGALDADRDGELSNAEIVAAGTALLKLDRNNDGKITPDEAFGPPPGRRDGDRRPGERGPRDGDRGPPEGRPGFGRGNFGPEAFRQRLKESDTDKDGKISKDEAQGPLKERFDRADTNSDGFIDDAEIDQMLERMRPGRPRDDN